MRHIYSAALAAALLTAFTPYHALGQVSGLSVTNYQIVSEQRVSATHSYLSIRADLVNTGAAKSAVTATAISTSPSIEVQGLGNLHFGPIPANGQVTSLDTFTILADRTIPLNYSNLQWSFNAPVAKAGPNQSAAIGATVTVNGSGSSNPSGIGFLLYSWTFVSRPPGTSTRISNATDVIATFPVDVQGEFIVQLTVTNGVGTDTSIMTVTTGNTPPVANAGPNQTVGIGATVQLNGSGSSDVNGDPLTYAWSLIAKPSGSTAAISTPTAVNPTFIADKQGSYVAQLVVSDGNGFSGPATVTITTGNTAPVANAGPNQAISIGAVVQLSGAGSTDADGDPLIFQWSLITVPSGSPAALSSASAVNPTFTADRAGTYVAQLIVNDGKVNSLPATVSITTGVVQPPTANAGPNQTVQHGTTVTLHGSGTDPQGLTLTFQWNLIALPLNSSAALANPNSATPTFLADLPGTYIAQLVVNNGSVNSPPVTVTITTTNTAPAANAGPNQNVSTSATVSLSGSASADADGDPLAYAWTFTSRPAGSSSVLMNANTVAPSFIADVAGTYLVQLIVSDPFTSSTPSTVTVTAGSLNIILSPDPLNLFGAPGTLTVTLTSPAPAGGVVVKLAALDPAVAVVPENVPIPANGTSAVVPVTPGVVGSTQVVASIPGYRPGSATVNVGTQSITVTLSATTIGITKTATGTVTLSIPAPPTGTVVALTSNPAGIVSLLPASLTVTIPAGGTTGTFTVTGVAEGSATIAASAPGYSGGSENIQVGKLGQIVVQSGVTVGPGQSAPLQISLVSAAPLGGVTITLTSGDTGKVTVSPTVFIAQGATTAVPPAQVTGVDFGSAIISASAPGFTGDAQSVSVGASLSFTPPTLTIGTGATQNLTLQLSAPSPAALNVTLQSSNPGTATVPSSVTIPQNATSVLVPVTAIAAGSTNISATPGLPNVFGANATVTVVLLGTVVLPGGASIGLGQSTPLQVSLSANAPAGGVTIIVVSSNPAVASLSSSTVFIPEGTNAPATQPLINGLAPGSSNISASAPGFGSASETALVTGSFTLTPQTLTIAGTSTSNMTVTLSGPAPAGGQLVNLTSNNPAIATVPGSATIAQNATTALVPVTGVSAGSTTVRASAFNVTEAIANVTVQASGAIGVPSNIVIGPGQSAPFPVTLPTPAPSDLTVTLVSSDPTKVTISPGAVAILAGQTQPATQPQFTGVNFGSSNISASAPGYTTGSGTVSVAGALGFAPPSILLPGSATQNVTLNLSVNAPAGGLVVSLSSNNPAVGSAPSTVTIAQGASSIQVPITGGSAGSATITATAPNVSAAILGVEVQSSGAIGLPSSVSVGIGQSVALPIILSTPAPAGGVIVTLSSGDTSKVTVSPDSVNIQGGQTSPAQQPQATGVGLGTTSVHVSAPGFGSAIASVTVTGSMSLTPANLTINGIQTQNLTLTLSSPAPVGGLVVSLLSGTPGVATVPATVTVAQNTTSATVPVTGVAPGSSIITASAANLGSATANVTVNPGLDILLPSGLVVAPGDFVTFPVTLARAPTQPTIVTLTSSDTSKATLSTQNLLFNVGSTTPTSQPKVNGISVGTVNISASAQGLANASTTVLVGFGLTFSPPNLTITGTSTQTIGLNLSGPAPPGGILVDLSSSNPGVATVNTAAFFPQNVSTLNVPVTGVAPGTTVLHASSSQGIPDVTANVTVVSPGTIGVPATTNLPLGQSAAFPVNLSTPAPFGGVTVSLSSSNNAVATVSPANVFVAAGQTQPASQPQVHSVNVGPATISASATGYSTGSGVVQVTATVTFTTQNVSVPVNGSQLLLLALSASAPLAGISVNLTSSNPSVASVQPSVNFFPDGSEFTTLGIVVNGVAPGTAVIRASGLNIPEATTTVTVGGGGPQVAFTTISLPNGNVGTGYSQTLGATGGTQPYTFALISGNLPAGLNFAPATGQIFGTPTTPVSNAPLSFRVTDSSAPSQTATVNLTLTIVGPQTPASIAATGGTPQSTPINTQYPAPLSATVRDAGSNPISGVTVTFTAPGSGPSGSFAGGANTAVTNGSGVATSALFTANGNAGTFNVNASVAGVGTPAVFSLNNTQLVPASITVNGGTPQSTNTNAAFPAPLSALVRDGSGNPLGGVTVTFGAPGSGASGSFAGGANTAVTNGSGIATSATFTANATSGSYAVNATVAGVATPAVFQLTNNSPTPNFIQALSGDQQSAPANSTFGAPFVVLVKDDANNPLPGILVNFTAPFAGPSGAFAGANTALTNASGIATSNLFVANDVEGSYFVSAKVAGFQFPALFALTNLPPVAGGPAPITITDGIVGQGLQTSLTLTLPSPALPQGPIPGQPVTITSADPSRLLLAGRLFDPGAPQITVIVPQGLTTVSGIFAHGLASSGSVTVTAAASGFSSSLGTVTLTPSGFLLSGPNGVGNSFTITQGSSVELTVTAARLNSSNLFAEIQAVRGGSFANVALSNTPQSLGAIAPPSINVNAGETTATSTFTASTQTLGATTLSAQAFGFTPPANGANNVVATVIPSGLVAPSITVGQNLQTSASVAFLSPVPGGGTPGTFVLLTLTSSDPSKVLLSMTPGGPGFASIDLEVPGGRLNSQDFYVQSLAAGGSVTYTASAPGFGNAVGTVNLAASGFVLTGPFGTGQNFFTTSGAPNSDLTVSSAMLNSGLAVAQFQPVRAGFVANVNVISSNQSVGTITVSPVTITGPNDFAVTQFDPATAGSTNLAAIAPAGFTTPSTGASMLATVTTPQIAVTDTTVGKSLQQLGTLILGQPAPIGGVSVTLISNSGQLRLATSATAAGTSSIAISVPAGQSTATYYLQSLSDTGTGTYTASAPGYQPKTGTVTFAPSGIVIAGPFGFGFALQATVGGPNQTVTVTTALLDPNNANKFLQSQALAGGTNLSVVLGNVTPARGSIVSPVAISGGSDTGTSSFHPLSAGSTTLSVNQPAGFTQPGNNTTVLAIVN